MKVRTTTYNTPQPKKKDNRLEIGIEIELSDTSRLKTVAMVQLYPLSYFAGKSPVVTWGMLYLSAIIYAIDRSVDRGAYSIDGWSRVFDVDISLPGHKVFQPLEKQINAMLSFLTGDYWDCHFVDEAIIRYQNYKVSTCFDGISQVNLFSGGMDSLIGAIDYMTTNPTGKLFLASHYDSAMCGPLSDQMRLERLFVEKFRGKYCLLPANKPAVRIEPTWSKELSCRSRSLMFLSIALIVASYARCGIVVPENGSVSLNFPLSPSRRASCSTRTTHPVFMKMYREIITALGLSVEVVNPYEKKTKGEMVKECSDKAYLLNVISKSNSCGKRSKRQYYLDDGLASHCGRCMPCMYRKAALIGENDTTSYGNQLITLFRKRGSRLSQDFFAMLDFLKKELPAEQIRRELRIAGMSGFVDIDDYVGLVERTRRELRAMVVADNNRSILRYMGC